jgi:Protein of unknown function (DUF4058)
MDPYLEDPIFWSSFHNRFLVAIADTIAPHLQPKYYVEIEARTYLDDGEEDLLVGIPDTVVLARSQQSRTSISSSTSTAVQIRPQKVQIPVELERKERYLQVREIGTDAVITTIELLSPTNKRNGEGRDTYEAKRRNILSSRSHLVELDFLRSGNPMSMRGMIGTMNYRILVSRSNHRPTADLYGFTLRDRIPTFSLPLQEPDESLAVDLQTIFDGVYDRCSYRTRLSYSNPVPPPSLSETDRLWIQELLKP